MAKRQAQRNKTTTNQIETKEIKKMAGLTAEQIQALVSGTRKKGEYVASLNQFIASGENGCDVRETWPEFQGRKVSTLKQGFDNAITNKAASDGADQVKVYKQGEDVFLVNMAVAAAELAS